MRLQAGLELGSDSRRVLRPALACLLILMLTSTFWPRAANAELIGSIRLPETMPDMLDEQVEVSLLNPPPVNDSWAQPGYRPLGVNLDNYTLTAEQITAARQTGCRLVRLTIPMEHFLQDVEPDWTVLDQVISRLKRADLEILPVLTSGAVVPEYYLQFCQDVAARYAPTFEYYQLLDNINYAVGVTTKEYASLLREARQRIRAMDPGAKIVLGGIRGVDMTYLDLLEQQGALHYVDVLAFNLYPPPGGVEQIDPRIRPEHCIPAMEQAVSFARDYGKQVWVTMLGVSTAYSRIGVDQAQQASLYARGALLLGYLGVERIIFAPIQDTDPAYLAPALCCGMLDVTGQPKASYYAMQTLNLAVEGGYHVDPSFMIQGSTYQRPSARDLFMSPDLMSTVGADELAEFQLYNLDVYAFWFYVPEMSEYRMVYWVSRDGPLPLLLTLSIWARELQPLESFTMLDSFSSSVDYDYAENMVFVPYQPLSSLPSVLRFEVTEHGRTF